MRNSISKPIHPDFRFLLDLKDQKLIDLFFDLREFILDLYPDSNEILYHTQSLTTVFSISDKLSDAFCSIPIYTNHLNLSFNNGSLLNDANKLLKGTGNLIRHIRIREKDEYRNPEVQALVNSAIKLALHDVEESPKIIGGIISRIKKK